jgi:sugar lactone lactonase YvrE
MPSDQEFTVTFEMTNIEYQKNRIFVYDFIWRLNDVIILDDNLFLIERDHWAQGEDNFVLTYNDETGRYSAKYTNISAVTEITNIENGYVAINDDETAIFSFTYNDTKSDENYYYFDVANLTEGLQINGVNDLIVDYDGSIYFKGVDNFIQDITGTISSDGVVSIDTEYVEREIIRVSPVN